MMRIIHFCISVALILLFVFGTISVSRAYSLVPDQSGIQEVELNRLELTGWDFIAGHLPDPLSDFSPPRSLPPHRAGAVICALSLFALCVASLFANRIINPAPGNLFYLLIYLAGFIPLENFKNAYFTYADSLHTPAYNNITIDSHMTSVIAVINGTLLLLALFNLIFWVSKKLRRTHYEKVR